MLFLILLFVLSLSFSSTQALRRRDAVIGTLTIPLAIDSANRYTVQIQMGPNDAIQHFNFTFATTLGYSIVARSGCSSCVSSASYNPNASSSFANLSTPQHLNINGASVSGSLFKENCSLRQANSSAWAYPNQTLLAVDSTNSSNGAVLASDASGIFGLGLTGPNLSFRDTIFGGFFFRNPHTSVFQYGVALNAPKGAQSSSDANSASQGAGSGGELHWLQPNPNAFQGNISWANVTQPAVQSVQIPLVSTTDWQFRVDSWTLTVGKVSTNDASGSLATIEPYFPEIYLPRSQANTVYGAISGAQPRGVSDTSTFLEWVIPCDTDMTWAISVAGTSFSVPTSSLVLSEGNGTCVGAIRGWSDPTASGYLLGSSFASAVYLIFSVQNDTSQSNSIGFAQRMNQSKSSKGDGPPVGAIVGGVIGGLALVSIVSFGLWFILRYQRRGQESQARPLEKANNPFLTPDTTASSRAAATAAYRHSGATGDTQYHQTQYAAVPGSPLSASTFGAPPLSPPASAIAVTHRSQSSRDGQTNSLYWAQPQGTPPMPVSPRQSTLSTEPWTPPASESSRMIEPRIAPTLVAHTEMDEELPPPEYSHAEGSSMGREEYRNEKLMRLDKGCM